MRKLQVLGFGCGRFLALSKAPCSTILEYSFYKAKVYETSNSPRHSLSAARSGAFLASTATAHRHRSLHQSRSVQLEAPKDEAHLQDSNTLYEGSFCTAHKRLKVVSIANTALAGAFSPLVLLYSNYNPLGQVVLASTFLGFGLVTTGLLHWFTSPYVHSLKYDSKDESMSVETINILGRSRWRTFQLKDVIYPDTFKPLRTFMVDGKVFYLEEGKADSSPLLRRLFMTTPTQ